MNLSCFSYRGPATAGDILLKTSLRLLPSLVTRRQLHLGSVPASADPWMSMAGDGGSRNSRSDDMPVKKGEYIYIYERENRIEYFIAYAIGP